MQEVQAQYVRASTSTGKIGTLPVLVMPKHCTDGTSTVRTCKHKHGQDSYVARAGHAKILYKWYKHSTSTVSMCKNKHGQYRYIARAGHAKTLYKWYKHSTHRAMVQAQYVRASTSTGKIGTLPVLAMPKHCTSGTSTVLCASTSSHV